MLNSASSLRHTNLPPWTDSIIKVPSKFHIPKLFEPIKIHTSLQIKVSHSSIPIFSDHSTYLHVKNNWETLPFFRLIIPKSYIERFWYSLQLFYLFRMRRKRVKLHYPEGLITVV